MLLEKEVTYVHCLLSHFPVMIENSFQIFLLESCGTTTSLFSHYFQFELQSILFVSATENYQVIRFLLFDSVICISIETVRDIQIRMAIDMAQILQPIENVFNNLSGKAIVQR